MDLKLVDKNQFDFLKGELNYSVEKNIISNEQSDNILKLYKVKEKLSFVTILVAIGSILIGLGVLSFIASNWDVINKPSKLLIIFSLILLSSYASYKTSENYPKTSRSLLYLSALTYGAGIFLIGQMFNFGGHFTSAFLLWAIGIIPMALIFRDKILITLTNILFLVYINGHFDMGGKFPYPILFVIPLAYYINLKFMNSKLVTFFNNLILLNTILFIGIRQNLDLNLVYIFFIIGLVMFFAPIKYHNRIFKLQGILVFGITGLIMTVSEYWKELYRGLMYDENQFHSYIYQSLENYENIFRGISIGFAILFILFLLYLIKRGNLTALVFMCITILKFYFDISYDFMPKSMFFIIGGLLLLGLGIYFEKIRKKLGSEGVQNE